MPVATSDVAELCRSDPAEIECLLVTDITDWKGRLATGPAEPESSRSLLNGALWCESIELDLGQSVLHPQNGAQFHDHEPPGCRSAGERTNGAVVVGLHHGLVDELRLPVEDSSSHFAVAHDSQNLGPRWRTTFPTEVGEQGIDRCLINFFVVGRWHLNGRFLDATHQQLGFFDDGWHSKIKKWLAIRVFIARDDGGRVGADHPAEGHSFVLVVEGTLTPRPTQPMTRRPLLKFSARR